MVFGRGETYSEDDIKVKFSYLFSLALISLIRFTCPWLFHHDLLFFSLPLVCCHVDTYCLTLTHRMQM